MLAVGEAVIGQLYLAIFVARLVALYFAGDRRHPRLRPTDPDDSEARFASSIGRRDSLDSRVQAGLGGRARHTKQAILGGLAHNLGTDPKIRSKIPGTCRERRAISSPAVSFWCVCELDFP